jgi:hypothetical protein
MKKNDTNPTNKRTRWLELAKHLTTACLTRQEKLRDLAPNSRLDDDERKQTLKAICKLNRGIGKTADEIAALESGNYGVNTILDAPTQLERVTVALMVVSRLVGDVGRELRGIESLVDTVGGMDMEDALAVRSLFRGDSQLRPHIHIHYAETLDESDVRLKESSLNRVLGNQPDESERMTEVTALSSKWR